MPISINGSGTVTGISVGGLPDGIVDTDMIAATAVTAAKRGPGTILQVVNAKTSTAVANSTDTFADNGMTANITPLFASSKILIQANVNGAHVTTANLNQMQLRLLRDSTVIGTFGTEVGHSNGALAQNGVGTGGATSYLDSPNTTSQITYKVQQRKRLTSTFTVTSQYASAESYITLYEVSA